MVVLAACADDLILVSSSPQQAQEKINQLVAALAKMGLELHCSKAEWMATVDIPAYAELRLNGDLIIRTPGCGGMNIFDQMVAMDGSCGPDITRRIASA